MIENALTLPAIGLLYDAAGVLALGVAFFGKRRSTIQAESETRFDYNQDLMVALITSRVDGIFGSTLLLIGFVLQFLGQLGGESSLMILALFAAWVAINILFWLVGRRFLIDREAKAVLALHHGEENERPN